jgi:hypothetical protein
MGFPLRYLHMFDLLDADENLIEQYEAVAEAHLPELKNLSAFKA